MWLGRWWALCSGQWSRVHIPASTDHDSGGVGLFDGIGVDGPFGSGLVVARVLLVSGAVCDTIVSVFIRRKLCKSSRVGPRKSGF